MMKDEAAAMIIDEFVRLRPKLYSFKPFDGKDSKKCKGIKKGVVETELQMVRDRALGIWGELKL